jgi:hypothetical protein
VTACKRVCRSAQLRKLLLFDTFGSRRVLTEGCIGSMADDFLDLIEKVSLRNSGAVHEGDVFSILTKSPFAVRSGEFALVDGALDCTRTHDPASSWATRYWEVDDWAANPSVASDLAAFEVKSCAVGVAGGQSYITTIAQRRRAAFYITRLTTGHSIQKLQSLRLTLMSTYSISAGRASYRREPTEVSIRRALPTACRCSRYKRLSDGPTYTALPATSMSIPGPM